MSGTTVVVMGGGVIGLSAAYHLARRGVQATLLEKGAVGVGSSSRAGGIITGHLWSKTGLEARKVSLRIYHELSEELGDYGYCYQAVGCLNLFSRAGWPEREKLLPLYEACHVPYEILAADEIRHRWPLLRPEADALGLFDPLGGYSEPDEYIPALARKCGDLGVDIREGARVSGIVQAGGRLRGVCVEGELLEAERVVCTVHSWTNQLLGEAGRPLPIKSFVHQRYLTAPLPEAPNLPALNANPYAAYLRPAAGNRILVGGETADRPEFGRPASGFSMTGLRAPGGFSERLRANARPLLPALERYRFEEERVGLICFTMDGEPILGAVPEIPGLFVGAAFHSGGFAYNPVAGKLLAELATAGETELDIAAFSPARFSLAATDAYLSSKLRQRDAFSRRH